MSALSAKLRSIGDQNGAHGFVHWCPGCESPHAIWTQGRPVTWQWDGDVNAPTVSPSVRNFTTVDDGGVALPNGQRRTLCHYFLRAGNIEFCGDCPHALAGKIVPLPDWPAELS